MDFFQTEVKDAWNHGLADFAGDMKDVGDFLSDTAQEKLKGDDIRNKAASFYGVQGPWYTVGYVQATTIERALGRKRLMECYLDPRRLMPTYNQAVKKLQLNLPTWPDALILELES